MEEKMTPLTKQEVEALISLVEVSKYIIDKKTDSATNQLKKQEWEQITKTFNQSVEEPRSVQQLRLKWENLKKATRKRSAIIMNNEYKPGGQYEYIGPDKLLDRVATLIGHPETKPIANLNSDNEDTDDAEMPEEAERGPETVKNPGVRVRVRRLRPKISSGWKRQPKTDDARAKRNLAIAEFYMAKKKLVEAKLENIQLHNEKLKLELGKPKGTEQPSCSNGTID